MAQLAEPFRPLPLPLPLPVPLDLNLNPSSSKKNISTTTVSSVFPPTPPPDSPTFCPDFPSPTRLLFLPPLPKDAQPRVAVIGVGYVGTHLVTNFSRHWDVLGFDLSPSRIQHITTSQAAEFSQNPRVRFSSSAAELADSTHYLISVPTLLRPDKSVDTSYLRSALETVFRYARPGATIVIESSVAVGMTRELLGPLAQSRGCFAGMSPERVDPGRTSPPANLIPKIISGLDDLCPGSLSAITSLYTPVFETLVPVSRPEVAEFTKLYENCQRMINIAYANEMADACSELGIDPYEVCGAARTKPFGYMDFRPGLGVGGHCIPVNPWYLLSECEMPLLRRAAETMHDRPATLARRTYDYVDNLGTFCREMGGQVQVQVPPKVLVVGMGFKRGQSTLSYSPGLRMARELCKAAGRHHLDVMFADPLVGQGEIPDVAKLADKEWNAKSLGRFDLVVVAMRQEGLDFGELERAAAEGVRVKWWC